MNITSLTGFFPHNILINSNFHPIKKKHKYSEDFLIKNYDNIIRPKIITKFLLNFLRKKIFLLN